MKLNTTFHVLVLFMAVLTFGMPFVTLAQQNSVEAQIRTDAAADANKDVNKPLWFGTGCLISGFLFLPGWYGFLLPPVGLTGMYLYRPDPPVSRLIGKSPEYVDVYTSAYKSRRGNIQARWASAGCLSGGVVTGAVLVGIGFGVGIASILEE